ncbi:hypothetical protein GCM10009847_10680 [Leucobacter tardus]|uniref:Uncharacterized protein n=1 Tax=Leucobacter tardus TaxID=501483 RepID=A0A939TMK3_9MICO|nr:hypothetical protein [Leucobacter tardus]MBO2989264.1 hypothetical protein [Leucobacter tardus]
MNAKVMIQEPGAVERVVEVELIPNDAWLAVLAAPTLDEDLNRRGWANVDSNRKTLFEYAAEITGFDLNDFENSYQNGTLMGDLKEWFQGLCEVYC